MHQVGKNKDFRYIKMHGRQNVKICTAKQAKQVYLYKTIKTKLCKNNAAIWFNKTCKLERQGGHHEVLDNIKIKHVSTTRYILSPRHQIRQHVSAIL